MPVIKDLASSPWAANPLLLASARKRAHGLDWKWVKVINEVNIRAGRKAAKLETEPFTKAWADKEKAWRVEQKKKGKKAAGSASVRG